MKKHQKQIFALAVILVFTATVILLTGLSEAGKHEKPDPVMDMLEDIYDIVWDTNLKVEGFLIQKTGQTTSHEPGDDGDLEKGYEWPDPRFLASGDGTVTDNLTGLVWLENASCGGERTWADALTFANSLHDEWNGDGSGGDCGLSDDSLVGDWRLPNIRELRSLIDYGQYAPALPSGHPFTNEDSYYYWSSTTHAHPTATDYAWRVYMGYGYLDHTTKTSSYYVWPVRDGK